MSPPIEELAAPALPVENPKSFKFWIWVQYAFIAAVTAGFLWFMISPIFNRDKGSKSSFHNRLSRIIKEWIKGMLHVFSSFIRRDKTRQKLHKPSAEEIRKAAENILGAYSHVKKRDIQRSATLFAQLIIWGSNVRQTVWKPSHAPAEYCALLAASKPLTGKESLQSAIDKFDITSGIIRCGEIFEKALYSAEVLSDEERKEFKELVEKIVSSV
jgi:hypothetical protein